MTKHYLKCVLIICIAILCVGLSSEQDEETTMEETTTVKKLNRFYLSIYIPFCSKNSN